MKKIIRTIHDVSLGLFVNALYTITQGGTVEANIYVIILAIAAMYITNKE